MATTSNPQHARLDALTGIRGLAALWVVSEHFFCSYEMNLLYDRGYQFLTPLTLFQKGYLAVDIFFILSGFIMALVHQKDFLQWRWHQVKEFLILRLARIYPVHLFALYAYFLYAIKYNMFAADPPRYSFISLLYSVLLLHTALLPEGRIVWNVPAWSICVEWFAYLAFPFMAYCLGRKKGVLFNLGMLGVLSCFYSAYFLLGGFDSLDWYSGPNAFVKISFEFTMGYALFNLYARYRQQSQFAQPWLGDVGTLFSLLGVIGLIFGQLPDIFCIPFFLLLIFSLATPGPVSRFLFANPLMLVLGTVSYSIYMSHHLILGIFFKEQFGSMSHAISHQPLMLNFMAQFFIYVLGISALMYLVIEKPMRELLRAHFVSKKPA